MDNIISWEISYIYKFRIFNGEWLFTDWSIELTIYTELNTVVDSTCFKITINFHRAEYLTCNENAGFNFFLFISTVIPRSLSIFKSVPFLQTELNVSQILRAFLTLISKHFYVDIKITVNFWVSPFDRDHFAELKCCIRMYVLKWIFFVLGRYGRYYFFVPSSTKISPLSIRNEGLNFPLRGYIFIYRLNRSDEIFM